MSGISECILFDIGGKCFCQKCFSNLPVDTQNMGTIPLTRTMAVTLESVMAGNQFKCEMCGNIVVDYSPVKMAITLQAERILISLLPRECPECLGTDVYLEMSTESSPDDTDCISGVALATVASPLEWRCYSCGAHADIHVG